MTKESFHVVFIHLDLGIGGAESLVLNLAKATLPPEAEGGRDAKESPEPSGRISIYTTHCSPTHCYDEVRPPRGRLSPHVHVRGSWIPRRLRLGGTALCSALRMLYLTHCAARDHPDASVFVLDVLPTGVPYLVEWWNVSAGVLFYCHFPDKLLTRDTVNGEQGPSATLDAATVSGSTSLFRLFLIILTQLKRFYRWALDSLEEWTMSYSDLIVVNSKFTMGEVEKVFPSLFLPRNSVFITAATTESPPKANVTKDGDQKQTKNQSYRVRVLYPAIESSLSKERKLISSSHATLKFDNELNLSKDVTKPILSLNRFERKKNVFLLLHAYDELLERVSQATLPCVVPPLMIAGGYDPLNVENVEHLAELRSIADGILRRHDLPLSTVVSPSSNSTESRNCLPVKTEEHHQLLKFASITFLPSVSNAIRNKLLSSASMLCYTPHREHFGIVPLEAMDAGVPVVAIRSGGPMETIVDGVTGYLVHYCKAEVNGENADGGGSRNNNNTISTIDNANDTVNAYADAIAKIIANPIDARLMGRNGRKRVDEIFGMEKFRKEWWELLFEAQRRGKERCYSKTVGRGYCVGSSLLRSLCELAVVVLSAISLTWSMKKAGWLEENMGILGMIKVWLNGRDEL